MFNIQKSILMQVAFSCKSSNQIEEAKSFLSIAAKYANSVELLDEIAYLQNEIKDYANSIETLKKCLIYASPQQHYPIRANLAKMYNHLNEPDKSLEMSLANREVSSGDYDTLMELAFSHYLKGDYHKSEDIMRGLAEEKDLPEHIRGRVEYNLGSYDIERGDFKRGLKGFIDVGHKIGIWKYTGFDNVPVWDGIVIPKQTLFIHAEGGIGDELICVRFYHNIKQLGMNPIWITNNKDLAEVFNRNGIVTKCSSEITLREQVDSVQIMAMYLPIVLDLSEKQVWTGPYLKPSEEYIAKWKSILPVGKKLAVKWTGNSQYEQDLHRSLPLEEIKRLKFDGIKINLQLEQHLEQDDMFNARNYINSIEDTLALLSLCDYTVTSCTSIAHMIGALGLNGVVCPPIASYYVWLGTDGCSNWYDSSLKVIRQRQHKDWTKVFNKVQELL